MPWRCFLQPSALAADPETGVEIGPEIVPGLALEPVPALWHAWPLHSSAAATVPSSDQHPERVTGVACTEQ